MKSFLTHLGWVSHFFVRSPIRRILLVLVLYGVVTTPLVPLLIRQRVLPAITTQTGASLSVTGIHWNPFELKLRLEGVVLGASSEDALLDVKQFDFDFGLLRSLRHRALAMDAITVSDPNIDIHAHGDHASNLDQLLEGFRSRQPATASDEDSSPLRMIVANFQVEDGKIRFAPFENGQPVNLHAVALDVVNLQTLDASEGSFNLYFQMDPGATVHAEGGFLADGSDSHFSAEARGLNLSELQTQLPPSMDLPTFEGLLDFSSDFRFMQLPEPQFQMAHAHLMLRDLRLSRPQVDLPLLTLQQMVVDDAQLDLSQHRLDLHGFELKSLGLIGVKDGQGQPGWRALFPPQSRSSSQSLTEATVSKTPDSPWRIGLDQVKLSDLHLIQNPMAPSLHQPDIRVGSLEGEAIVVDLGARRLVANSLNLDASVILFGLGQDAVLPLDALVPQTSSSSPTRAVGDTTSTPWTIGINQTQVSDLSVGVVRVSGLNSDPFEFKHTRLSLGSIDTQRPGETPMVLSSEVSSGGKVGLNGQLQPSEMAFTGEVRLDQVGLAPFKSLLAESYRFDTVEGYLSSQLKVALRIESGVPTGDYSGLIGLDNLRLTQAPNDRKLLGWQSLTVDGIKGRLNPFEFSANEIRLQDPDGVIAIHADKSSNLSELRVAKPIDRVPSPRRPGSNAPTTPDPDIHIRRIRVEGGKLDYTDETLILPFSTQIVDLKGAITGWTLDPNGKSLLELNGRIAPYGEASIHGQLRPLDPKSLLDVDLHFENVVLASLTPYSATFAGRRIENGKLDLNAHYRLEEQQLKSDNRIYLKQLRLGDKVESPKAVSLPLDLAVALLSDAEGNIDMSLPIEGKTDAPDFDYGVVFLNAFGNLIKKAVLSPFTAITGALGLSGGEELNAIAFDLGSDVLTPPEKEKIVRLSDALHLKPQLQLILNGSFDPEKDKVALRHFWLRQRVASRLGEALKPGEDPDPVNPTEAATQRVLEALAQEYRLLEVALTRYVADKGHPVDRIGLVGTLMGKGSKTPDFYELLAQNLADQAPIGANELKELADRRMRVVKAALSAVPKPVDSQRVRLGDIQEQSSDDGHHLLMPLALQVNEK
ncbi:MAG: hypothetical protein RL333_84 [Pseudomonadota bacterium]